MLHLTLRQSPGGATLVDSLPLPQSTTFSTNEHGFADLNCFFPLSLARAFHLYDRAGLPHVEVAPLGGGVAWEGRLEDVSIVADGIRLMALGYQRAFSDAPYSALWSGARVDEFRPLDASVATNDKSQKFESDTNNRLYIAIRKNEVLSSGNFGSQWKAIPSQSLRPIIAVSFDYEFNGSSSWQLALNRRDATGAYLSTPWSLNGTGSLQTGTRNEALTGCDGLSFHLSATTGLTYTGETGDTYIKITNLRIKTTSSASVYASEIAAALATYLNGLNSSQIQAVSALIESPGLDLRDEVYEDAWPTDILTRLARLGDNQSPPRIWEWGVWENRILHLRPRGSAGRTWYVDVLPEEIQRTIDLLRNSAYSLYQDENGRKLRTAAASSADSRARYQVTRQEMVSASTTSGAQAGVQRDAFLADHANPIPRVGIDVRALYDSAGVCWPQWAARSGDLVVIRNLPVGLSTEIDRIRSFRVAETLFTVDTGRVQLTPEAPLPRLETLLARWEEGF